MKYLLIDTANMFFRARHGAHRASDTWTRLGFALHITLAATNKVAQRFKADHVIFALEGRSWRKDFYKPYKANRAVARAALTEEQAEEDKMFWETYDALTKYLSTKTNCSVIRQETAEADDIIARWIHLHPKDEHIIISSDTDFVQLLAANVTQYNGITDELLTIEGIFDAKGKPVVDKKTQESKTIPDPKWLLFEKCMRGDSSDNVFSAFPGVRTKGTKNKVGLQEAFEDKDKKGYNWNNLMLQRWTDHDGVEHRVLDDYERNRHLIDLTCQPDNIKLVVDQAIHEQISHKDVGQVGSHFLKFCGKYELIKCSDQAEQYGRWLNETYKGVLDDNSSNAGN
jgi:5'-3' exonuclease